MSSKFPSLNVKALLFCLIVSHSMALVGFKGEFQSCLAMTETTGNLRLFSYELPDSDPNLPKTKTLQGLVHGAKSVNLSKEALGVVQTACKDLGILPALFTTLSVSGDLNLTQGDSIEIKSLVVTEIKTRSFNLFPSQAPFHPVVKKEGPEKLNDLMLESGLNKKDKALPPNGTGYGSYVYPSGDSYVGYFVNYKRQGKGKYTWKDGVYHDGYWEADLAHGSGVRVMTTGIRYEGVWTRGILSGVVTILYPSGQKYEGEYSNNAANGYGVYTWPNGQKYSGNFVNWYFEGQGTMDFANKDRYIGSWLKDERSGYGTMDYFSRQEQYVGYWSKDFFWGRGQYNYKNGAIYNGDFVRGLRHGTGTLFDKTFRYSGAWADDSIHGIGELLLPDIDTVWKTFWQRGDVLALYDGTIHHRAQKILYTGTFKNLEKIKGEALFENGDSYKGEFLNDLYHGFGSYTFKSEALTLNTTFVNGSPFLTTEESLKALGFIQTEPDTIPAKNNPSTKEAVSALVAVNPANTGLVAFLSAAAGQISNSATLKLVTTRMLTMTGSFALAIVTTKYTLGDGIVYFRRYQQTPEIDLNLYVGRTMNFLTYECRKSVHERTARKLYGPLKEGEKYYDFDEFETDIFFLHLPLKEQAYLQLCDSAEHFLCAPYGPGHTANKINAMGIKGFEKWQANNPELWNEIQFSCGIFGAGDEDEKK